jgi:general secretion pathway protein K
MMQRPASLYLHRQRGVAVITALLLTTLAITIVASLFWQQQVQVRSIENQRLQLQKQWILRGALDYARLVLREDARNSNVDYLGEPWSVPLEETKLDQYDLVRQYRRCAIALQPDQSVRRHPDQCSASDGIR